MRVTGSEKFYFRHRVVWELDVALQYWKGKDHRDTEYWEQPWEKEARKLQQKLMKAYMAEYES